MGSVKVTVYGRIKPREKNVLCQDYKIKFGENEDQITFAATKTTGKKVFRFKKIFGEDVTQKQVFEAVAKPVIKNVFEGYNGTIFTYGQTGSGKTHTMTGSLEDWVDTGLIPRTVQEVFQMKESDTVISITYFEIYNEHVYDLIRAERTATDVPQDSAFDENTAITSFRNLSVHIVRSACEALLLYRRGDANKMVAETSSNARSSRSHVIFSIGFEFPHPKQEMLSLKPVLYLVDLAGSERITKCKTPMANPWETRYINLSLHYLEQVLVALRQPGRVHIPYRNSLMTALLRNSLGGNCITAMVATFSLSMYDIEETMQTCRFAERIAQIKNEVKLSELMTPQKEVDTLRRENERLRIQLKLMGNDQVQEQLTQKDKEKCTEMVQNFLRDNDFLALPLTDVRRMEYCFCWMRNEILRRRGPLKTESKMSGEITNVDSAIWSYQTGSQQDVNDDDINNDIFNNINNNINNGSTSCNGVGVEKFPRRKRSPLEIPKVNITYNTWNSTEQLSEKPSVSSEKSIDKEEQPDVSGKTDSKYQIRIPIPVPQLEGMKISQDYVEEREYGIAARPGSYNFGLQLSGDLSKENVPTSSEKKSVSSEKSIVRAEPVNLPGRSESNQIHLRIPIPPLEDLKISEDDMEDREYGVAARPGSSNFGLKFSAKPNMCGDRTWVQVDDDINTEKTIERFESKIESLPHTEDQFPAIGVPLTGDQEVDEEILRFYQLRSRENWEEDSRSPGYQYPHVFKRYQSRPLPLRTANRSTAERDHLISSSRNY